jgi:hypothetical protein
MGGILMKTLLRALAVAVLGASALSACSTTGDSFHSMGLSRIVPGQTTLAQASDLLGAAPVDTYAQGDGSVLARWAYKMSLVTDAVYARQELWLEFGPGGRFERVVRKVNVPSNPAPPPADGRTPTRAGGGATRGAASAPATSWGEPMDDTVVAYPVGSS